MALPARISRTVDPLDVLQREFDGALGRIFGGDSQSSYSPYAVDVREDADHVYVDAELPGFKKEEVDITLENRVLTVAAERKTESKDAAPKPAEYLLKERRYTRFLRSFTLPTTVNEQGVAAKLEEGILHITLDKRPETKPRKVTVA